MTKRLTIFFALLALATTSLATDYKYSVGSGLSMVTLKGGDFYKFDWEKSYTFAVGHRLNDRWALNLEYSSYTMPNDITSDSTAQIGSTGSISNNDPLEYQATRIGLSFDRKLLGNSSWYNLTTGLGGGVLFWKGINAETNRTYVLSAPGEADVDYSATELFLTGQVGLLLRPFNRFNLKFNLRADYLTGAGRDFSDAVNDDMDRLLVGGGFQLAFLFGSTTPPMSWRSDVDWPVQTAAPKGRPSSRDGDGDGVADDIDICLGTPSGALVDKSGCAIDSDNDNVPDGLDHCPGSHPDARGKVDVFGCPIDSDFDGLADYTDACPNNLVGAVVDANGCPIDSDGDSIPDGLDDCEGTLIGLAVDKHGCVDLSTFAKPMILNIDYPSGGFEIDPNNRERVRQLAATLNFIKELKIETEIVLIMLK